MIIKFAVSLLLTALTSQVYAFQCYLTLVKDSCWTNYDVKVTAINAKNNTTVTQVEVPKGKSWTRQAFDCEPAMRLMYKATFAPEFWESDQGKVYSAIRYWTLPGEIKKDQSAWDIPVCFPSAFSAVPFPPDATNNCKCDFFSIPPVPLGQPGN